jgi:hypothetical protein
MMHCCLPTGRGPQIEGPVTHLAPVALFAWQRPAHTQRVISALAANPEAPETDVFAFVDGPRHDRESEHVAEVIRIAEAATGFRSVSVRVAARNLGLSRSITGGVTDVLQHSDRVIVVEDDIVVSRSFLGYMNSHLELYANDDSVASVHGYVYPHSHELPPTFFIAGADCWGWGTWRRAWEHYRPDGRALLEELTRRGLLATFDFGGTAGYVDMLRDQIAGRNDSWAVRWYASALLCGMYTLYPNRSLATNIGADGSGSHGGVSSAFDVDISHEPLPVLRIPVEDCAIGRSAFTEFFASQRSGIGRSHFGRLGRRILRPVWTRMPSRFRHGVVRLLSS